jgi:hypothetical protein
VALSRVEWSFALTPERHRQIVELCNSLLEIESAERSVFLAQTCGDDEALRHELESLLVSHSQAESFLESPAIEVAAQILADDRQRDMRSRRCSARVGWEKSISHRILSSIAKLR